MKIPNILKKKRFWFGVIFLFLTALVFDFAMASFVLVKSLSSGQWNNTLLALGLLYAAYTIYQSYLPKSDQKQSKWYGRILLLVIAVLTFMDYGYFKMVYFLATVFIFSRFSKWIVGFIVKRTKPKFRII